MLALERLLLCLLKLLEIARSSDRRRRGRAKAKVGRNLHASHETLRGLIWGTKHCICGGAGDPAAGNEGRGSTGGWLLIK